MFLKLGFFISLYLTFFSNLNAQVKQFSSKEIESEIYKLTKNIDVKGLTFNQITQLDNYQVLDTRSQNEYQVSHLKNAIFVNYDDFDYDLITKKIDKNKPILLYCSIGYRSGKIAAVLKKNGYQVFNLLGGIFEWVNNGKPVYTKSLKTNQVHGYSKSWGKWLTKGIVVY